MNVPARLATDSGWTRRDDLRALVAALGAQDCRYVGGVVRDTLLGLDPHDVDVATRHRPDQVIERLREAGIATVPTGIAHGTVTALLPAGNVEVTTLRRDVATDGRRAAIAYAGEWRDDAARRDFTINALYAHPETLEIDDFFGGLADLATRRVRFIGDADQRIREDHLRILRFFRFQARFGSTPPDPSALAAIQRLAPTLKGLSRERVAMELLALLALPDPVPTLALMAEREVLRVVLPEAGAAELAALAALITVERREDVPPDPIRRLAALLPSDSRAAEQVAARLRLSKRQKKRLAADAGRQAGDADNPRALAYRLGYDVASDRVLIAGGTIAPLSGWTAPAMPVSGGDVVAAGIAAGPEVARVLQALENRWLAQGFPDEARTRQILAEMLAGHE